jgi:hypothetical protein
LLNRCLIVLFHFIIWRQKRHEWYENDCWHMFVCVLDHPPPAFICWLLGTSIFQTPFIYFKWECRWFFWPNLPMLLPLSPKHPNMCGLSLHLQLFFGKKEYALIVKAKTIHIWLLWRKQQKQWFGPRELCTFSFEEDEECLYNWYPQKSINKRQVEDDPEFIQILRIYLL